MNDRRRSRVRRPDDWPSSHVRARADLSDRLDFALEPPETAWLAAHLEACPDCRVIADAYVAQRLELRSLLDRTPPPPRDLWARTAAAIEAEARFGDRRAASGHWRGRRFLAPSALLAAALVVAVAVGTLTSSRGSIGDGDARSSALTALGAGSVAIASDTSAPGPTRIPVTQKIAYVVKDASGAYSIKTKYVDKVCPSPSAQPCDDSNPTVDRKIDLDQTASTVIGSRDGARLIVANDQSSSSGGTISVLPLGSEPPSPAPTPSVEPSVTSASPPPASPSGSPTQTPGVSPSDGPESQPPTPPPSATLSPSPSVTVSPTTNGTIEIAHDVILVGQSAAYSPAGDWFAFTARPADNSAGPDIFAWRVGEPSANRVTNDHRSIFGSWLGEALVGSTIVNVSAGPSASAGTTLEPASFILDPSTDAITALPETGRAWRPAVDPSGRRAIYWTGSLRVLSIPGFAPDSGRLVLGDWATGLVAASDGATPTSPAGDQGSARHETTITAGRLDDWDARWDATGTHVAIWIADPQDAAVGRLSLYTVDSFDGKIDLKSPLLADKPAVAGYSISDGQLVWAEPAADGATNGRIQLLAWTDEGVGTVSTVTGPVIVIR